MSPRRKGKASSSQNPNAMTFPGATGTKARGALRWQGIVLSLAGLFLAASPMFGNGPYVMNYGGRLATSVGEAIKGPVDIEIKFFREAAGGSPLPVSPIVKKSVPLFDGVFQIEISELTPAELHLVFSQSQGTWVEITDLTHKTPYPRQKFSAVPYALKVPVDHSGVIFDSDGRLSVGSIPLSKVSGLDAALAQKSDNSKSYGISDISGLSSALDAKASMNQSIAGDVTGTLQSSSVQKIRGMTVASNPATNSFLKFDGTSLVWSMPSASGSGDMLKVDNLSGLGNNAAARSNLGLGTLATASEVTTSLIADGTITDADISNAAAIADTKLATISTAGKVSGSAITGTIGGSLNIMPNGNVGIGTTNPASKLQVQGTISSMPALTMTPTGYTQLIDFSTGNVQNLSLSSAQGTVALTFSGAVAGAAYILFIKQGPSTTRQVTWPANVKWQDGLQLSLSSNFDATDIVTLVYNGNEYFAIASKNFL